MKYFCILLFVFCLFSCQQTDNPQAIAYFNRADLYSKTVKQLNDIVLMNNFPPMIASRNYVYACIAGYECVAAGDKQFNSLHQQIKHLPALPSLPHLTAVNYQLAALLSLVKVGNAVTFPEGSLMTVYNSLLHDADSLGLTKKTINQTTEFSDSVVMMILRWSKKDAYAQTRSGVKYTIKENEIGRWVPTPPQYMDAVEPNWAKIRPMIIDSAKQFSALPPPIVDIKNKNSAYYKALLEVKTIGEQLTTEQKHIASFWDDNPFKIHVVGHVRYATKSFSPSGHWLNIIGIAAKHNNDNFNITAALFAQGAIALFDAFISCWQQKYYANYVRPETMIAKHLSTEWNPFIQTPPFPSYVSGHATISAAIAEVMTKHFGEKFSFIDTSLLEFGIANRQIVSFRMAAEEAAMSRLYGGIHYRFDNDEGNTMGKKIGLFIAQKLQLEKKK